MPGSITLLKILFVCDIGVHICVQTHHNILNNAMISGMPKYIALLKIV
jgi:hypothetical protein